jgi:DNA polymerase-1
MAETVYIVDAHSLIYQVFHAIPEMSAPDGRPTNAVFGFTRDLLHLTDTRKPTYLICAFDAPGLTFRDAVFPEYKANRAPMPDNLRPQIEMIRQVVHAMGIPLLETAGFEADDIVATVVRMALERGVECYICTGDKDARQLISSQVSVFNIRKNEVYDSKALAADWGIRPNQVIDLLAMTGDSVDNIPGIEGVGPKTAATLLQEFETLEGVLASIDRISGKKRQENLRAGADRSRRSRELVALRSDVPIELDWELARAGRFDNHRLVELFRQFGFQRLTAQFSAQASAPTQWEGRYHTVTTLDQLATLAASLASQHRIALELVLSGPHPMSSHLVGISVAWQVGEAWYVPIRAPLGAPALTEPVVVAALRPILESESCRKVGHNLKLHQIALRNAGVQLGGIELDTMVADYLMEAGERSHALDQLSSRYLKHNIEPVENGTERGRPLQPSLLSVAETTRHAAESADVVLRVGELQERTLREDKLWPLFESVERPLIQVLAEMELTGVFVDTQVLDRLRREFGAMRSEIERSIYELAGGEFNIASNAQLREVLFDRLQLRVVKKTRTGASTDQEVLEELAAEHPLPKRIIEYRQISKLMATYVEALPALVDPETGRVHATFNQVVASTGRLSSNDPNLQNIPIRTELGRQIRQAFAPRPLRPNHMPRGSDASQYSDPAEWRLLTSDYSQIELRILAHLSADAELRRAFAADQDIHNFVAAQIFGVSDQDVTAEMRRVAKTVNFGVIYGLSPFGLATRLGITREEAEAFIAAYFAKYQGVNAFIRSVLERAHRDGAVTTMLGRRRRIAGVRSKIGPYLNQPEREAVNTVVQGSAADLIKMAMVHLRDRMVRDRSASRMLLQIHDELVFEVPRPELVAFAGTVRSEMTSAIPLDVPLKVDLSAGPNWLDVQPLES